MHPKQIHLEQTLDQPPQTRRNWRAIGDILVEGGLLSHDALGRSLTEQRQQNVLLGEILLAKGMLSESELLDALSKQFDLPIYKNYGQMIPRALLTLITPDECVAYSCAPVMRLGAYVKFIIADPHHMHTIQQKVSSFGLTAVFYLSTQSQIHEKLANLPDPQFIERCETPAFSGPDARMVMASGGALAMLMLLPLMLILAIILPSLAVPVIIICFGCFFIGLMVKLLLALFSAYYKDINCDKLPANLPKVSLLIPLYKEARMVAKLHKHLMALNYPKALLELIYICEEDDQKTIAAVRELPLGYNLRLVICPNGQIKTKPRAMNYALRFCGGDIIGIYDAEDAPERNQIRRAVAALNNADQRTVCVQARLDFFNQTSNWLARCFTLEYAAFHNLAIRGLAYLDWPIPLGGTSAFIKRDILEQVGLWDAHNVTEDAELGLRLYCHGYRVRPFDSVTYEEANNRIWPWIKQRSRWMKGFFITWATYIYRPYSLLKNVGFGGFIFINAWFFTSILTALLAPPILIIGLLDISFGYSILIPAALVHNIWLFWLMLMLGETLNWAIYWFACQNTKHQSLRNTIPSMIFYWPLKSCAAMKALLELVFAPNYWDKTEHGCDHSVSARDIETLTYGNHPIQSHKDV